MTDWLLVVGCIFGNNLLPAFGPPTWVVLVFFRLNSDLPAVAFVLGLLVRVDWGKCLFKSVRG
jgi:hypothetical protein